MALKWQADTFLAGGDVQCFSWHSLREPVPRCPNRHSEEPDDLPELGLALAECAEGVKFGLGSVWKEQDGNVT